MIYYDSSLLVRLYVREKGWGELAAAIADSNEAIPLIFLHELEIANALQRAVFEKLIEPRQRSASLSLFAEDLRAGLYRRVAIDIAELTHRALQITQRWTARLGTRTLDVLHVAAAQALEATSFATADLRQRKLARAVGLR